MIKMTEKQIENLSKTLKVSIEDILFHTNDGWVFTNSRWGKDNIMYGKKHSAETKKKISDKAKLRSRTEEYKQYLRDKIALPDNKFKARPKGWKWWNNGVENKTSVNCPGPDFKRGRIFNEEHAKKFFIKGNAIAKISTR